MSCFAYTTEGHQVKPADRGISTFHRVEMSVPSINGIPEAHGYEDKATASPAPPPHHHNNLISDILHNNRRKP